MFDGLVTRHLTEDGTQRTNAELEMGWNNNALVGRFRGFKNDMTSLSSPLRSRGIFTFKRGPHPEHDEVGFVLAFVLCRSNRQPRLP